MHLGPSQPRFIHVSRFLPQPQRSHKHQLLAGSGSPPESMFEDNDRRVSGLQISEDGFTTRVVKFLTKWKSDAPRWTDQLSLPCCPPASTIWPPDDQRQPLQVSSLACSACRSDIQKEDQGHLGLFLNSPESSLLLVRSFGDHPRTMRIARSRANWKGRKTAKHLFDSTRSCREIGIL